MTKLVTFVIVLLVVISVLFVLASIGSAGKKECLFFGIIAAVISGIAMVGSIAALVVLGGV